MHVQKSKKPLLLNDNFIIWEVNIIAQAPIESQNIEELEFHSSNHKVLGMEGSLLDRVSDNAPKIVGGLRLISILMASVAHPLLGIHGELVLGSEAILLLYGNKKDVQQYKTEKVEEPFLGPVGKIFQPSKYPIESSAALDTLGEIPHFILGASIVFDWDLGAFGALFGEEASAASDISVDSDGVCPPGHEPIPHGDHVDCLDPNALPVAPDPWESDYAEKLAKWEVEHAAALEEAKAIVFPHYNYTINASLTAL